MRTCLEQDAVDDMSTTLDAARHFSPCHLLPTAIGQTNEKKAEAWQKQRVTRFSRFHRRALYVTEETKMTDSIEWAPHSFSTITVEIL